MLNFQNLNIGGSSMLLDVACGEHSPGSLLCSTMGINNYVIRLF
jgi:hypothetical protein